jgi:hypothetical protein
MFQDKSCGKPHQSLDYECGKNVHRISGYEIRDRGTYGGREECSGTDYVRRYQDDRVTEINVSDRRRDAKLRSKEDERCGNSAERYQAKGLLSVSNRFIVTHCSNLQISAGSEHIVPAPCSFRNPRDL